MLIQYAKIQFSKAIPVLILYLELLMSAFLDVPTKLLTDRTGVPF